MSARASLPKLKRPPCLPDHENGWAAVQRSIGGGQPRFWACQVHQPSVARGTSMGIPGRLAGDRRSRLGTLNGRAGVYRSVDFVSGIWDFEVARRS